MSLKNYREIEWSVRGRPGREKKLNALLENVAPVSRGKTFFVDSVERYRDESGRACFHASGRYNVKGGAEEDILQFFRRAADAVHSGLTIEITRFYSTVPANIPGT